MPLSASLADGEPKHIRFVFMGLDFENIQTESRQSLSFKNGNVIVSGGVAKWMRNGLQSRLHWFDSSPRLQFISD